MPTCGVASHTTVPSTASPNQPIIVLGNLTELIDRAIPDGSAMMSLWVLIALFLGACSAMDLNQLLQDYQSDYGASADTTSYGSSGSLEIEDPSYGAPTSAKLAFRPFLTLFKSPSLKFN